jgi:hypothetical protein
VGTLIAETLDKFLGALWIRIHDRQPANSQTQ